MVVAGVSVGARATPSAGSSAKEDKSMAKYPFPAGTPCAYCNALKKITEDHVPPKCLFGKGASDLITVPSCADCNGSFSQDEECFRDMLAKDQNILLSHDGKTVSEKAVSAFQNHGDNKKNKVRSGFGVYVDPDGVKYHNFSVDDDSKTSIKKVVSKCVKGLFWHENKESLPLGYEVETRWYNQTNARIMNDHAIMYSLCKKNGFRSVRSPAFKYGFFNADKHKTCWILQFYESSYFKFVARTKSTDVPS